MTEEREAMEWLKQAETGSPRDDERIRAVLVGMLAQPRMPEIPTDAMLLAMERFPGGYSQYARNISIGMYHALYSELSKPPEPETKEVEVWHIEHVEFADPLIAVRSSRELADHLARLFKDYGHSCITVTGPHKQIVPV